MEKLPEWSEVEEAARDLFAAGVGAVLLADGKAGAGATELLTSYRDLSVSEALKELRPLWDRQVAALAAAAARQGELRRALADLLSYATLTEGNGAPEDPIGNAAKLLAAPAPPPASALLERIEAMEKLPESWTLMASGQGSNELIGCANELHLHLRRLRAAIGLLPREGG